MHINDCAGQVTGPVASTGMPAKVTLRRIVDRGGRVWDKVPLMTLIFASTLLLGCAGAVTITVCESGCDNTSIQSALNYIGPGDTIEVRGGTYDGNINIRKNVSLVGIPDENGMPVINGSGHGSVITIGIDGVSVTRFKLTNSGDCGCGDSGVRINCGNNTISGNNITGNHYGVNIKQNTTGNRIFGNSFINNSVNARDNGENQWYGESPASSDTLSVVLGYLGLTEPGYIGNYYDDYDEEGEGCTAEEEICGSPYNITGKTKLSDPYPRASPRF